MFIVFSNHFDALMSKIIFKNKKNIILMHFGMKNSLKNNNKHPRKRFWSSIVGA
jgi:hypothetical protein